MWDRWVRWNTDTLRDVGQMGQVGHGYSERCGTDGSGGTRILWEMWDRWVRWDTGSLGDVGQMGQVEHGYSERCGTDGSGGTRIL